jgi:hypothetical protein
VANKLTTPTVAFGTWPTMLYFIFIVASTLRLDFVLPATSRTAAVAVGDRSGRKPYSGGLQT